MSIGRALKHLYPAADPLRDYIVVDRSDGQGPKLTYWNEAQLGPRPTAEQLAQAEADALAAEQAEATRQAQAVAVLKAAWPTMTPKEKAIIYFLKKHETALREME